jgi:diguanylate cyclase (GGDEF)-like protein/PAS domain S-box-containing protein
MQERASEVCFQVDQGSDLEQQDDHSQSHQQLIDELMRLRQRIAELEALAARSLESAHQAVDRITDGFFVLDQQWHIVYLNHYTETLVGKSRVELVGKNFWHEYPDLIGSVIDRNYQTAMATGVPIQFEAFGSVFHGWWEICVYPDATGLSVFFKNIDPRKQIEAQQQSLLNELTAWQTRYEVVRQVSRQLLYEWNLNTEQLTWGSNTECILGYSQSEMPQRVEQWLNLIHPDDRAVVQQAVTQAIVGQFHFQTEYRLRCQDGRYIWVTDQCQFLLRDGRAERAIGLIADITDRKQDEQALWESEAIFRQLVESIREVCLIVSTDHSQLTYINPAHEPIWEQSRHSLYQNPTAWLDAAHSEDHNRVVVALERQQGELCCQEYCITRPDSSIRWICDRTSLIRDQLGCVHQIAGIAEDVSDRRHAETALNELVEFNQQLIDSIQEGVVVYSHDFRYLIWNRAMEQMSGLSANFVLGKRPLEVFPFLKGTGLEQLLARSLDGETVTAPDTYFQIPETGKSGWTVTKFSPFRDTQGQIIGVIGIVHDITERKQAEQRLEHRVQFERMLTQLATELMNVQLNEIDDHIQQGLQTIGRFAQVDWVWIYLYSAADILATKAYEWVAPGVVSPLVEIETLPMQDFIWSIEQMQQSQPIFIADVSDLPAVAVAERRSMEAIGAKSFLAVPLTYQGQLIGSLGFNTFERSMHWSSEDIDLFTTLGTVFASTILRKRNSISHRVTNAIPDLLIRLDRQGIYLDLMNPGQIQLVKPRQECIGQTIYDILPHDVAVERDYYLQRAFETREIQDFEYQIVIRDELIYAEARIIIIDENEALLIIRDISNRKQTEHERERAEAALRQQAEREQLITKITENIHRSLDLNQILNTAVAGIRQLLQTDRVLFCSIAADWNVIAESVENDRPSLLGLSFDASAALESCLALPQPAEVLVISEQAYADRADCADVVAFLQAKTNLIAPVWQGDDLRGLLIAQQCATTHPWQQSDIKLLQQLANQVAIAIQQADLCQHLQLANQELQRLASLDGLTQVANRRRFDEYFTWQWQYLQRQQAPLTLLLCDVDFFKPYNDRYGHQAGDDCLRQIARAIEQSIKRSSDLVARYGGEEFIVVLPNTTLEAGMQLALKIQETVAQLSIPHAGSQASPAVTLSIGLASAIPTPLIPPQTLIAAADRALYTAKLQGRNTCCVSSLSGSDEPNCQKPAQ